MFFLLDFGSYLGWIGGGHTHHWTSKIYTTIAVVNPVKYHCLPPTGDNAHESLGGKGPWGLTILRFSSDFTRNLASKTQISRAGVHPRWLNDDRSIERHGFKEPLALYQQRVPTQRARCLVTTSGPVKISLSPFPPLVIMTEHNHTPMKGLGM